MSQISHMTFLFKKSFYYFCPSDLTGSLNSNYPFCGLSGDRQWVADRAEDSGLRYVAEGYF